MARTRVALNPTLSRNPLKYSGLSKYIKKCDFLKEPLDKRGIRAPWIHGLLEGEHCFRITANNLLADIDFRTKVIGHWKDA